jgi:hypothetical protein
LFGFDLVELFLLRSVLSFAGQQPPAVVDMTCLLFEVLIQLAS